MMFKSLFVVFANMNLRMKLIILFLISVLVPLVVFGSALYKISVKEVEVEMRKNTLQTVQQVNLTLDEYIHQMDTLSTFPYYNKEIEHYMLSTSTVNIFADRYPKRSLETVGTFLENLLKMGQDIEFVSIISNNGNVISRSRTGVVKAQYDFYNDPIFKELRQSTGEKTILPLHESDYLFADNKPVYSIGRKILSFNEGFYIGYVLIDYNESAINKIGGGVSIGNSGNIILSDKYGNVMNSFGGNGQSHMVDDINQLANNEKNRNEIVNIQGNKIILVSDTSDYSGLTAVGVLPFEDIHLRVEGIKTTFYSMAIICVTLVFVFSILISNDVIKPIRLLQNMMKQVEKGDTEARIKIKSRNELGQLFLSFNRLLEKLNLLLQSIKKIEAKKQEAELMALKSQINPHFLYNTLDSIRMIAILDDNHEIARATEALANMFRYNIKGQDIVDIKEEINQAMNYIDIQKIRYEEKFQVIFNIDESLTHYKVIKLLIQPIIENAITHGIENKKGSGTLWFSVQRQEQEIVFTVKDDGVGMDPSKIAELYKSMVDKDIIYNKNLGLRNVNERLKLYFGEGYGLVIESKLGEGTCVSLKIPTIISEEKVIKNVISHVG